MMIEPFDPDPKLSGENYLKRRGRRYKKSTLMKYFKLLEKRRAKKLEEQQDLLLDQYFASQYPFH